MESQENNHKSISVTELSEKIEKLAVNIINREKLGKEPIFRKYSSSKKSNLIKTLAMAKVRELLDMSVEERISLNQGEVDKLIYSAQYKEDLVYDLRHLEYVHSYYYKSKVSKTVPEITFREQK